MFFWLSRKFLQLSVRCIISWSRPVVAITRKIPARNCFQKNVGSLGLSKKNVRAIGLWLIPLRLTPSRMIKMIHSATDRIRQQVLSRSVQTTDFTPPRKVIRYTMAVVRTALSQKGTPSGSNTRICSTALTTNKRTLAPSILLTKKIHALVLYEVVEKRWLRYWYILVRLSL